MTSCTHVFRRSCSVPVCRATVPLRSLDARIARKHDELVDDVTQKAEPDDREPNGIVRAFAARSDGVRCAGEVHARQGIQTEDCSMLRSELHATWAAIHARLKHEFEVESVFLNRLDLGIAHRRQHAATAAAPKDARPPRLARRLQRHVVTVAGAAQPLPVQRQLPLRGVHFGRTAFAARRYVRHRPNISIPERDR